MGFNFYMSTVAQITFDWVGFGINNHKWQKLEMGHATRVQSDRETKWMGYKVTGGQSDRETKW
jgi:hypothetical protein